MKGKDGVRAYHVLIHVIFIEGISHLIDIACACGISAFGFAMSGIGAFKRFEALCGSFNCIQGFCPFSSWRFWGGGVGVEN